MAQPPASPPSSDITGVDRDEPKVVARGKTPDPRQQEKLKTAHEDQAAWPDYDPEIATEGNSQ